MPLQFERQGAKSEVYTRMYPDIIGGVCSFCGVMDTLQPSEVQYLLGHVATCPYSARGGVGQVRCSYCPDNIDPTEVVKQRKMSIHESPTNPGQLLAVCDSYNCSQAHFKRFKVNI